MHGWIDGWSELRMVGYKCILALDKRRSKDWEDISDLYLLPPTNHQSNILYLGREFYKLAWTRSPPHSIGIHPFTHPSTDPTHPYHNFPFLRHQGGQGARTSVGRRCRSRLLMDSRKSFIAWWVTGFIGICTKGGGVESTFDLLEPTGQLVDEVAAAADD